MRNPIFWIVVALLVLCGVGGGSARGDVLSLLVLRPAAVLALGAILLLGSARWSWEPVRPVLLLLLGLWCWVLLQLLPLPAGLWSDLPGHSPLMGIAAAAGIDVGWRPLTLTPSLTSNSFAAFVVPAAVLVGLAALTNRARSDLLTVWVLIAAASVMLGVAQIAGPDHGFAYTYRVTNYGFPVGIFANRNHQAAFLAAMLPMLPAWVALAPSNNAMRSRTMIAASLALTFVASLMITGSRAGIVLGLAGAAAALVIAPLPIGMLKRGIWPRAGLAVVPLALIAIFLAFGRSASIDRIFSGGTVEADHRLRNATTVFRMVADFFPLGSGFGSFDRLFRSYEPAEFLGPSYFNHAHNDLAELALTGGLVALLVLGIFLVWWVKQAMAAILMRERDAPAIVLARGSAAATAILLMASLTDYPLRPPVLAAFFVMACVWLRQGAFAPGKWECPADPDSLEMSTLRV